MQTMKPSVVNTFLFFLVLSSSPSNISSNTTTPHHKATLTDSVIAELCKHELNPDLCKHILSKYKGSPLSTKLLHELVSDLLTQTAHTKKNMLLTENDPVKPNQPELIATCSCEYEHAMTQLKDATDSVSHGRIGDMKKFVLNAMRNVNSCDVEVANAKTDQSTIGKANRNFKNVCSVVLRIWDKLLHPVKPIKRN